MELLEDQDIRVKLTVVPTFWQKQGLQVGQEHILNHYIILGQNNWAFEDSSLPEFSLSINSYGKKTFAYYGK